MTNGTIDAFCKAVDGFSASAVACAVEDFISGRIEREHRYRPSGAELADRARMWQRVLDRDVAEKGPRLVSYRIGEKPPAGTTPLGPTRVDFGSRSINLEGMTHAQKEAVLTSGGLPSPDAKPALAAPMLKRMA